MTSDEHEKLEYIASHVTEIKIIINGNGKLGLAGKVEIMWGYRYLFISAVVANIVGVAFYIIRSGVL